MSDPNAMKPKVVLNPPFSELPLRQQRRQDQADLVPQPVSLDFDLVGICGDVSWI